MRLSARLDYALRAIIELAIAGGTAPRPVTAEQLAHAKKIPPKFLESILLQLRRGGIVHAQRGPEGGYWLARPAERISLADVIYVIDGPPVDPPRHRLEGTSQPGPLPALEEVWAALRASEQEILETVSIADVVSGTLPRKVQRWTAAWGSGS